MLNSISMIYGLAAALQLRSSEEGEIFVAFLLFFLLCKQVLWKYFRARSLRRQLKSSANTLHGNKRTAYTLLEHWTTPHEALRLHLIANVVFRNRSTSLFLYFLHASRPALRSLITASDKGEKSFGAWQEINPKIATWLRCCWLLHMALELFTQCELMKCMDRNFLSLARWLSLEKFANDFKFMQTFHITDTQ